MDFGGSVKLGAPQRVACLGPLTYDAAMTNSGSLHDLAASLDLEGFDPNATQREIEALCNEAKRRAVHGVCVLSSRLVVAKECLDGTSIKLICPVGYPSGAVDFDIKRYETEAAIDLA